MSRARIVLLIAVLAVAGFGAVFSVHALADGYLDQHEHDNEPKVSTCAEKGKTHQATIQHNTVTPQHIDAALCDQLTITNLDDRDRNMAFGPHDHHTAYDGHGEETLKQGQSETVVLNQPGTFIFHDHMAYEVRGTFTVK